MGAVDINFYGQRYDVELILAIVRAAGWTQFNGKNPMALKAGADGVPHSKLSVFFTNDDERDRCRNALQVARKNFPGVRIEFGDEKPGVQAKTMDGSTKLTVMLTGPKANCASFCEAIRDEWKEVKDTTISPLRGGEFGDEDLRFNASLTTPDQADTLKAGLERHRQHYPNVRCMVKAGLE